MALSKQASKVLPLTVNNVLEAVQGVKNWWGWLTFHQPLAGGLGIPEAKQDEIKRQYSTEKDRRCEAVKYWLQNGSQVSWRSLIWRLDWAGETTAADRIRKFAEPLRGETTAADRIRKFAEPLRDDRPTLPELIKLQGQERKINIPVEIGTKYTRFGVCLLDDRNGARVDAIAHKRNNDAEMINQDIFREWLQGRGQQPITWNTLVETLRDIGL